MLNANDVVIVLRPELDTDGNYDGDFKVIHAVIGPVTMHTKHVYDLSCLGLIMTMMLEYVEQLGKPTTDDFTAYVDKNHPNIFEDLAVALIKGGDNLTTTISTRVH